MARLKRNKRGSIVLQSGETITLREQKALRSAVNSANRKRKVMIEALPKQAMQRYKEFGIESDFVYRKKSASFKRFRNKKEFNRYLRSVQAINKKGFIDKAMEIYRFNLIRAIFNTFGNSGYELIDFIGELDNEELRVLSLDESFNDIGFVYNEPISVAKKLSIMTKQVATIRRRKARTGKYAKA